MGSFVVELEYKVVRPSKCGALEFVPLVGPSVKDVKHNTYSLEDTNQMASVTLVESAKLSQDLLISGVIESIVTVDRFFEVLPFLEIEGNALAYNRENALGDVQNLAVGGTITAKAAATFTKVTTSLTTIIGDAEVNNLIQNTRSNFTDQKAAQIMSKAKNIGLTYRDQYVNGTGASDTVQGMISLAAAAAASQTIAFVGAGGDLLTFDKLDNLIDIVKDKNGIVDYFQMNSREIRVFFGLLRSQGGATIQETVTLPSGATVPGYRGVPIFRNDNIPLDQTAGTSSDASQIFAGTLDDGSNQVGISGLTAVGEAGIRVSEIGEHQTKDESITRVKFYCGFALFSELGVATATGIGGSNAA
jgi:hypothetical protein